MRKWNDNQQSKLNELLSQKEQAEGRLSEDVTLLCEAIGVAGEVNRKEVHRVLTLHGQAILDMLIVHFEPSLQPATIGELGPAFDNTFRPLTSVTRAVDALPPLPAQSFKHTIA